MSKLMPIHILAAHPPRSDTKELQIEIKEKRALCDQQVAAVKRRLEAIEKGRYDEPDEKHGGGRGFIIGTCICTYRSGSSPPTSCSDPRCGPVKF
jgi:hypothetical protein